MWMLQVLKPPRRDRLRLQARAIAALMLTAMLVSTMGVAHADCPHVPVAGPSGEQWRLLALMTPLVSTMARPAAQTTPLSLHKTAQLPLPESLWLSEARTLEGALYVWLDDDARYTLVAEQLNLADNLICRWPVGGRVRLHTPDGVWHTATFARLCGHVVLDGEALLLSASHPAAPPPTLLRYTRAALP